MIDDGEQAGFDKEWEVSGCDESKITGLDLQGFEKSWIVESSPCCVTRQTKLLVVHRFCSQRLKEWPSRYQNCSFTLAHASLLFSRCPFLPEWWNYKSHKIAPHLAPLLHVLSGLGFRQNIATRVCLEFSYTPGIFCKGGLFHTGWVFRDGLQSHMFTSAVTHRPTANRANDSELWLLWPAWSGRFCLLSCWMHIIDLLLHWREEWTCYWWSSDLQWFVWTCLVRHVSPLTWLPCRTSCQCSRCFSSALCFCFSGLGFVCLFGLHTWSLSIFSQAYHFCEAHAHFNVL